MPDDNAGNITSAPSGGIAPGAVQGAIAARLPNETPATSATPTAPAGPPIGTRDQPYPGDPPDVDLRARTMERWFPDVAKREAAEAASTATETAAAVAPPIVDSAVAVDPYANTADQAGEVSPELLEMARSFQPVLEQFRQQGYQNADALTQAQADQVAQQQLQDQQLALYQQFESEVQAGNMDPAIAERLYLAEVRAMQAQHQASQVMQRAAGQAQAALVQQAQQQYPNLPPQIIREVLTTVPGEAGTKMLASVNQTFQAALQQQITAQAARAAAQTAQAPARVAGAAGAAPGSSAPANPAKTGGFQWLNWLRSQGMQS